MRAKLEYPPIHAAQHLPDGSDPLLRNEIGFYAIEPDGGNPVADTDANPITMSFAFGSGHAGYELLDLADFGSATAPDIKLEGMYALLARVNFDTEPTSGAFPMELTGSIDLVINSDLPPSTDWAQEATTTFPLDNSGGSCIASVGFTRYFKTAGSFPNQSFQLQVQRTPGLALNITGFVSVQRIYGPAFMG